MIKFKVDSRDLSYHDHFGSVQTFPNNFIVDSRPNLLQSIGDVRCTCYTVDNITQTKTGNEIDIGELWNRVPHDEHGADPRKVFSEVCKNGVVINGTNAKPFSSFFTAHTGDMSYFDNVRSALMLSNESIAIWCMWRNNWNTLYLSDKGTPISGHCFCINGWITIGTEKFFIIEAYNGQTQYMSESLFNSIIKEWSSSTAVLSTIEIDAIRKKELMEKIIDACQNCILLIQQLLKKKK